ncbi:hypothetical protein B0H16DRAFT_1411002 [Mycena metata]|uniref:F-box domain-containing protein n=1 Tax=Mycena metata TaxID=1033252 RepID=A0AAD7NQH5_9AGAR|nr:hypothetical protein B0H16DRAFT_1411002 [Mycena metata]
MHRALEILEVFETICECSPKDLAALARTCTLFLSPALDRLWKRLPGITPVLKCMPTELFKIKKKEGHRLQATLQRTMEANDWQRLAFYLPRVRSFTTDYLVDSVFLEAFQLSMPGAVLFPNLQELAWHSTIGGSSTFHHIRMFLSAGLTTLRLDDLETYADFAIFSILAAKCPSLRDVVLAPDLPVNGDTTPWDDAVPLISQFVCGLLDLESLSVPGLNDSALTHLARLPRLQTLEIRCAAPDSFVLNPDEGDIPFASLVRLTLPACEGATAILAAIGVCSLVEFECTESFSPPTQNITRELYTTLANSCSHTSLKILSVSGDDRDLDPVLDEEVDTYSVTEDCLAPLFSFANLTYVSLSHPVGFDLDDAVIRRMATAWPRIESLALHSGTARHLPTRVTLAGLEAISEHCPRLKSLWITLDATRVPKIPHKVFPTGQTTLIMINVALSPITTPRAVGKFLGALFPRLKSIYTLREDIWFDTQFSDEDDGSADEPKVLLSYKQWKRVEEHLKDNQGSS